MTGATATPKPSRPNWKIIQVNWPGNVCRDRYKLDGGEHHTKTDGRQACYVATTFDKCITRLSEQLFNALLYALVLPSRSMSML